MEPPKEYTGTLRAKITILSIEKVQVEWFDPITREVVWTETAELRDGMVAMASQIVCTGEFRTAGGIHFDDEGRHHPYMHADMGMFGVAGIDAL